MLFERVTPRFGEEETFRARSGGGVQSNSDARNAYVDVTVGNPTGFARASQTWARANDYDDGSGERVRAAYKEWTSGLILGWTPDTDTRVELAGDAIRGRDILFAGTMDSPKSDAEVARLSFAREAPAGPFAALRGEAYLADVDHYMDNFSLRELTAPQKMRVPSHSDTRGGRVSADWLGPAESRWTFGADYQDNDRRALRWAGPTLSVLNSVLWPDVSLSDVGVFAETRLDWTALDRVVAGLRYDRVESKATAADRDPPGALLSPNALYTRYYGTTAKRRNEDNVGGFLRVERQLESAPVLLSAGVSRTVRTADASERFIAANSSNPADRWVGNPTLDPERHLAVELGTNLGIGAVDVSVALFYDWVRDFIMRDRARGQSGIYASDGASIYRNVRAELAGGEAQARMMLGDGWSARLELGYVRGQNTADDHPLAQIPPFSFALGLDYASERWGFGVAWRGQARQERVDDDVTSGSGLDPWRTPGWARIDGFVRYRPTATLEVAFGVENLFDKTYAYHLNRENAFDPGLVQINEPGREVWAKMQLTF